MMQERFMPPAAEIVPWLYITNWNSWEEVGDWYAGLSAPSLQVNDAIRELVSDVTKSKSNDQDRMAALYHAIASKIRYVSLSFGIGGYRPHAAAETLKNRFGDCKDKATLLVAALSELGIKAHLVLINASSQEISLRAPSPAFDHAIVAVPMGKDYLWLDATSDTCTFGDLPSVDQNKLALVVKQGDSRLVKTPLMPASKNGISVAFDAQLAADGNMEGTMTWKTGGFYDSMFRGILKEKTPDQRSQWLNGFVATVVNGLKSTDPTHSDVEDLATPLVITFKFQGEGYTTDVGDLLMVKLPEAMMIDATLAQATATKDRKHAAVMGFAFSFITEASLRLPAGYEMQSLPKGMTKQNELGSYTASYAMEGGVLKMMRKLAIDVDRIPVADYAKLKELTTTKAAELRKQLMLKKE
jgi:hypothetical protein